MKLSRIICFGLMFACLSIVSFPLAAQKDSLADSLADTLDPTESKAKLTSSADVDSELPAHLRKGTPKSLKDVRLFEKHVQNLLKKIRPATVNVGGGTGVVVSKEGLILTVQHVNRKAGRRVRVVFPDGKRVSAITLGGYQGVDAGMMKITDEGTYPFVEMGDSSKLENGQWCLALGYPVSYSSGQEPPVRLGRVLRAPKETGTTITTDCTIMGGDSGGPLFDLDGKVIGIHSRVNGNLARNIHVPVNIYSKYRDRLLASEEWSNRRSFPMAYLGVKRAAGEERALIQEVLKGHAAEKAGVRPGDLITEFAGKRISSFDALLVEIAKKRPNDKVTLKVRRDGKEIELSAKLGLRTGG